MQPLLAPVIFLFAFIREVIDLGRDTRYRSLLAWVALILSGGTLYYHNAEGWRIVDSLYFCVITLATIGYGDYVPLTDASKIFTIIYTMIGLSILATFFNMIAKDRAAIRKGRSEDRGTAPQVADH